MNIRCSHSETYVACWDNNDSTLIHSVYSLWKPQVTTHELSFQDNLPMKHHDLKMYDVMLCPEVCVLEKCGVSRFSTLNLRVHSFIFMRICVESASTPGILREDQDSDRKTALQSPAEDLFTFLLVTEEPAVRDAWLSRGASDTTTASVAAIFWSSANRFTKGSMRSGGCVTWL